MTLITKYRLLRILETSINDTFTITLADQSNYNYGPDYRAEEIFDSIDEALVYVEKNEKWHYCNFTIIPIYSFSNF